MKIRQLVLDIAFWLVDQPAAVILETIEEEESTLYRLRIATADAGNVIGKNGRTAQSIRSLLSAIGGKANRRLRLDIVQLEDERS